MDIGGQNQKELQVEGSWIPQTPVRPIMPKPPVIYTDKQGNQLGVSNWLRPEGFLPGFNGGPHVDGVGACFASTNSTIFDGYRTCRDELDRWKDISFTALLAAANLAAVPANSQPYSNGNSSLGSGQCVDGNYTEEPQHGKFTHPEATYALNFHPGRMDGSFSNQITSHFAPITTDKVIKEKCKHVVEIQALCKDERTNKERNEQNQITATGIDNNEIHTDKELQKLEADSSLAGASKLVMESHKADKVGGHVIDLNKTPKQKPRRKKHRPRVITESKPRTREPVTPKPPSNGIPTSKRKYVRKKPLRKVSKTPPAEAHGKSSVVESPRPVKKSCRRALHFDMEGQGEGENSICMSASNLDSKSEKQNAGGGNQSKLTVHLSRGIEVIVESSQLDTAYDLNHSVGKMLESCILQPTKQAPATTISAETTAPKEKQSDDFKESLTEGEDQVTACNVMANSAEIFSQTDTHLPTSPHGSNCAEARQAQRSKRMHSSPIKHPYACRRNLIGMHSDILSAYQRVCWAFPRICKKKRTEKVQCADTSSTVSFVTTPKHLVPERAWPQTDSKADPSTLRTSYWFSGPQSGSSGLAGALREAGRDFQLKPHASSFISKQTQRSTNERSKVPIQVQAFNSVTSITQCMMEHTARQKTLGGNRQQVGNPNGLFAHMEAPVALLGATLTTKKGTKKRVSLVTNLEISHTEINISKQNQLPARLPGDPPLAAQKVLSSTEVIAEQLKHLDISREDSDIAYQEQTALVPYIFKNEKQNMLVPYERDGTLVPFPIKKKHTRPKVDLDEETNRVWKLLMVNIDSEGIDGADEEKTKWWEGERNVFGGRASSFIAQMHQVQAECGSQIPCQNGWTMRLQEASSSPIADNTLCNNIQEDKHMAAQSQIKCVGTQPNESREALNVIESTWELNKQEKDTQSSTVSDSTKYAFYKSKEPSEMNAARIAKSRRVGKELKDNVDWDSLRKQAEANGRKRERTANTADPLDWDAVRCADVNEIAKTIKERGMNNRLAERIKDFLNRLVTEHGSINLEWLRDVPPDKAKEYLPSIRGLGLKSVECVRLLTLHHLAFPVDTNVGRIAVRLGWVPLQPLPESLQLHLLELYPVLESIQKYLWPRLCKLDQRTLYELHYQMITFGKICAGLLYKKQTKLQCMSTERRMLTFCECICKCKACPDRTRRQKDKEHS